MNPKQFIRPSPDVRSISGSGERYRALWIRTLSRSVLVAVAVHVAFFLGGPAVEVELDTRFERATSAMASIPKLALPRTETRADASLTNAADPSSVRPPDPVVAIVAPTLPDIPRFEEVVRFVPPGLPKRVPEDNRLVGYERMSVLLKAPEVRNRGEIRRFLERGYRRLLEGTEITGAVTLLLWVDETGVARRVELVTSSGYQELDELAMALPEVIRFRPARRGKTPVRVIVHLPIEFELRSLGGFISG